MPATIIDKPRGIACVSAMGLRRSCRWTVCLSRSWPAISYPPSSGDQRCYLARWTLAVDSAKHPSPERLARAIAMTCSTAGTAPASCIDGLAPWTCNRNQRSPTCSRRADREDQTFEVLVPVTSVPDHQALASHLAQRNSPQRISAWFDDHEIADKPRHNGAFSYSFTVKDAVAAARAAGRRSSGWKHGGPTHGGEKATGTRRACVDRRPHRVVVPAAT
jgi:hypothetical protein